MLTRFCYCVFIGSKSVVRMLQRDLSVGCSVYVSDQHSSLLWSYSLIELFSAFRLKVGSGIGTKER